MEAERKAAEALEEYGEEEETKETVHDDDRRQSHRGRGGFGGNRGDRGDEVRPKRVEPKGEWGEFEGSDDDYEESAYTKPSRGGGQQVNAGRKGRGGKGTLALDEDNFPTL